MGSIASLSELLAALRRRAWIILLVLILGLPAAVWFALNQPRIYEANGIIQIEAPAVAETVSGMVSSMASNNQLDLIQQKMFARDNLLGLIEEFDLFPEDLPLLVRVGLLRDAIIVTRLVDPSQSWRPDVQSLGLAITVRLDDPVAAADVANALLDGIITEARSRSEGRASQTLQFLLAEEARAAEEVAQIEADIASFREDNVDSLPEIMSEQRSRLNSLTDALIEIERDLILLQNGTDRLRPEEAARQSDQLGRQRDLIAASIAETEAAIAAAPEVERELGAMNRTLDLLVEELTILTARRTEAAMNQLLESQEQAQRFEILESAIVPEYPVSTSRTKLALAGGVLVTFAAFGLALAVEILNPRIRTAGQMQRQLGVIPVIVVPVLQRPGVLKRQMWIVTALLIAAAVAAWGFFSKAVRPLLERLGAPLQRGGAQQVLPGE